MSELERLIQEHCPDGVVYEKLSQLAGTIATGKLNANAMVEDGEYPFFTCSIQNYRIDTYAFDCEALIIAGNGEVGETKYYKGKFNAYQRTYVLYDFSDKVSIQFLYHYLRTFLKPYVMRLSKKGSIPYITLGMLEDFKIPVPPIEVQREIVKILDKFTEFMAELKAELTARKKQYDELAYRLLIKNNRSNPYKVKDLCDLSKGKTPIQKAEAGEYPLVVTTSERKSCNTFQYDSAAVCIPLVSSRGHGVASLNHVYYQEGKFALGNILCAVIPKDQNILLAKYMYFYFECTKDYTLVPLMKGGANVAMHIPDIEKLEIYVPNYDTQKSIVSKLEALDEYCNVVLPAEIEARQKQYEYYRDKLLTFKEASL